MVNPSNDKGLSSCQKTNENNSVIYPDDLVKVTEMNHILEVQHMEKMNNKNHIQKIDKDRYIDKKTGEIKEFKHIENRKDSYNSLRQTFKKLRYLINNNFVGDPNELHVILTYKENMRDTERLYKDFKRFMTRLKRKYKDKSTIDYLSVVEPQGRGAWHCHVLLRFNDLDRIFIKNSDLRKMWGQGYVKIKSLKEVDNIGAYLSAYLADVELSEETAIKAIEEKREVVTKRIEGKEKKIIKGGRLHMYPPGMNLYRKSKGVEYPEREMMSYKKAKEKVGSAQPNLSRSYEVDAGDFKNTIIFEQYNLKRL